MKRVINLGLPPSYAIKFLGSFFELINLESKHMYTTYIVNGDITETRHLIVLDSLF